MTRFKHYLSICNSGPSEILSIAALKHSDELLRRNLEIIKGNLTLADQFFRRHDTLFRNNPPQSGPIAFHKIMIDQPIDAFCEELVQHSGVLLLPASIYDYKEPFFRMGYGRKSFGDSLSRFEQYLTHRGLV